MFFNKPDIRYVDMCIYIDDHIYSGEYDESLVYQYLFFIVLMLATKRDYYTNTKDKEDFSLYAASYYLMRLTDSRQFDDNSPITPIRSILNFVKKTLYGVRAEYNRKFYHKDEELLIEDLPVVNIDSFSSFVHRETHSFDKSNFSICLEDVSSMIKSYITNSPYRKDKVMSDNIYISCLLSFLNSVTLPNSINYKIDSYIRPTTLTDKLIDELYLNEKYNSTILYHLDSNMYNYITVLTNRIKIKFSQDLAGTLHTSLPSCVNVKNLLLTNQVEE
jgi:hypothetical protein